MITNDTSDALNTSTEKPSEPVSEWNTVSKKRTAKEQTKAKTIEVSTKAVEKKQRGRPRKERAQSGTDDTDNNASSDPSFIALTKKKQQYLQQEIQDKSGQFSYLEDPENYRKARKRLQNRESAVRSRMKKREEMDTLEEIVAKLEQEKASMESENQALKRQNEYFQDLFAKQTLGQNKQQKDQKSVSLEKKPSVLSIVPELEPEAKLEPLDLHQGGFNKRQKLDDSFESDGFFKHVGDAQSLASEPITNYPLPGTVSEKHRHNDIVSEIESEINVEDFMLSRSEADNTYDNSSLWGAPSLFGLAVVCSVMGVVSSGLTNGPADKESFNFGRKLKGAMPGSPNSCENHLTDDESCVETPSWWQQLAFNSHHVSVAVKGLVADSAAVPLIAYFFFLVAFVSFVAFIRPRFIYGSTIRRECEPQKVRQTRVTKKEKHFRKKK